MIRIPQRLLSVTIAGAVALTPVTTITVLGAGAAYADRNESRNDRPGNARNQNRNDDERPGNSRNAPGHNRDDDDGPGNSENAPGHNRSGENQPAGGEVSRELGHLNAAHASELAFLNANADSNVGHIASYQREALESLDAAEDVALAEDAYAAAVDAYDGRTSAEIEGDIIALDPGSESYEDDLDLLKDELDLALAHEQELRSLNAEVAAARDLLNAESEEENDALLALTGGQILSDDALAELRSLLGL